MLILVLLYLEETSFLFLVVAESAKMLVHVLFFHPPLSFQQPPCASAMNVTEA
jgi:hypothetical protein